MSEKLEGVGGKPPKDLKIMISDCTIAVLHPHEFPPTRFKDGKSLVTTDFYTTLSTLLYRSLC